MDQAAASIKPAENKPHSMDWRWRSLDDLGRHAFWEVWSHIFAVIKDVDAGAKQSDYLYSAMVRNESPLANNHPEQIYKDDQIWQYTRQLRNTPMWSAALEKRADDFVYEFTSNPTYAVFLRHFGKELPPKALLTNVDLISDIEPWTCFIALLEQVVWGIVTVGKEIKVNDSEIIRLQGQTVRDYITRIVQFAVSYILDHQLLLKFHICPKVHYFHHVSPWAMFLIVPKSYKK